MQGWIQKFLRLNLSKNKFIVDKYDGEMAKAFLGGRGFAAKIFWDEIKPEVNPLSPENKLIFSTGPLTGLPLPSSGKFLVASKSPITGAYGDGNLGSWAAVNLRKAGFDFLIIEGKHDKPCYVHIKNDKVEILDARELWGLGTFEVEKTLREHYNKNAGILQIGPAGENKVLFSTVTSQNGRSGGRTGMGAVMGSKNLKAIVIEGDKDIPVNKEKDLRDIGKEAYDTIRNKPNYEFWMRQGTMMTIEWSQEHNVLPAYNFKEGFFDGADKIGGDIMESIKETQRGCPYCNMICGNIVKDCQNGSAELDYENVAMLGSNIGIDDLKQVSYLTRMADDLGIDTISSGNTIGFIIECSSKGIIEDKIEWGDFDKIKDLLLQIANRTGLGDFLAQGVRLMSQKLGADTAPWAMHVKGLEISAYDCHSTPGMALAYGTSPIGAHHKDAWIIAWEVTEGRKEYSEEKVDKLIEQQRVRGGIFESLVTCRFPWVEINLELDWYPKLLKAATGFDFDLSDLYTIADRIYTLIRSSWVREHKKWNRNMDIPPARWFKEPTSEGEFKESTLDYDKYNTMLDWYYEKRGWTKDGIPKQSILENLGLDYVIKEL
ncbi:MAG: aldehyde ferredoxin oxidoreductase family protein [Candidatus Bathyarchaeota archaeon]|nr:aldehyde ferredoxin oxidoreductase family protein [Candidatus Bathyarchaeota archaeon]